MAINKIPESQLPTRSVSESDYVRVVGADGKSYRVPKSDFDGGGGGGGTIDGSLSPTSTNAVQNKAIYSALEGLKDDIGDLSDLDTTVKTDLVSAINEVAQGGGGGGSLTQNIKQALLQLAEKVAYVDDDGQDYYDDLEDALYPFDLLSSISAVYTQSGTVYDTDSLDSLKSDLVVTGNYSDSTTNTIRNYTLSGTLTVGTSTITVTYGGKTATFTVTVTQSAAVLTSISCVYTQSGTVYDTDTLDSLKTDLVVTAHYSDSTTETVASADYTLSGTLTVGTSTVTVTYSGFTTTFNATVTEQRYIPSQYTWLYDPRNNTLFSNSGYVTKSTGGTGGTEALSDGALSLNTNYSLNSTSNFVRFTLNDGTTANGFLSCRAKINDCFVASSNDSPTSFRLQLSNGSTGAQAFIADNDGLISVIYYTGSSKHVVNTSYSMDEYHVFELSLSNGTQALSIDGEQVFSTSTLSSNYCTANAILNQAGQVGANPNGTSVSVDWIAYYEVA